MCLSIRDAAKNTLSHFEHAGFEVQTVNNGIGYRCGYIRVLPGHPWFGKSYGDLDAEVHGGLTFAAPGEACPTHDATAEWWLGFDCAHGGDAPDPSLPSTRGQRNAHFDDILSQGAFRGVIRNQNYVDAECRSLAEQARAATL